jgi:hypothetical protein
VRVLEGQADLPVWELFSPSLLDWLAKQDMHLLIENGNVECLINPGPPFKISGQGESADSNISYNHLKEALKGNIEPLKAELIDQDTTRAKNGEIPVLIQQVDGLIADADLVRNFLNTRPGAMSEQQ